MGLILIEHNIRFVTRMAKHVYVLASGRLIAEGTPQAVMQDEQVVVAYLGKK
jgi:branched-chain amino acid transport system ATP-binding protein